MSAEIVNLDERRPVGNGAREALIDIVSRPPFPVDVYAAWAEKLMIDLWARGYKIIPLDGTE